MTDDKQQDPNIMRLDPTPKILLLASFDRNTLRLIGTPFGVLIELQGVPATGESGGPGLRSKVIRVALPPLTTVTDVSAKALASERISKKAIMIAPLQYPKPGMREEPQSAIKVQINQEHNDN